MKAMVEYLDANKDVAIVSPTLRHFRDDGWIGQIVNTDYNCFLCRRDAAIKIGGFRKEYMLVEDADFFLRMMHETGPIALIKRPLYRFREHARSLSYTQIRKRQYISTLMHYDLISRGIEKSNMKELFFDRIKIAALYKGYEWIDKVVDFAKSRKLPFAKQLETRAKLYKQPLGWVFVKLDVAVLERLRRIFGAFFRK